MMTAESVDIKTLPDLDEDALIEVFKYLDRNSLLSTMATCKRFEAIIGNNIQFYGKFQLDLNRDEIKWWNEELLNIRRRFGIVEIESIKCSPNSKFYQRLLKIIQKIGQHVIDLKISYCNFSKHEASFVNLMKLFSNVRKIYLKSLNFGSEEDAVIYKGDPTCQFKQLKSLELCMLKNEKVLAKVFHLDSLDHLTVSSSDEWPTHLKILFGIKKLRSLEISWIKIDKFECPADFCLGIQKLTMRYTVFSNEKALTDFTNFIKNENQIMELAQNIKLCNYELNVQLLSKSSLETVDISLNNTDPLGIFQNLQFVNPAVKNLLIRDWRFPQTELIPAYLERYFPKIRSLYLHNLLDISEMSSLNFSELTDLRTAAICASSLKFIKVKQLQKFTFELFGFGTNIESLQTFVDNHHDLEYLDVSFYCNNNLDHPEYETEYYRLIIEGFPKLKILKMRPSHYSSQKTGLIIEMFEKYAAGIKRLDCLELNLRHEENKNSILELFQRIFPEFSYNVEILKFQGFIVTFKKH